MFHKSPTLWTWLNYTLDGSCTSDVSGGMLLLGNEAVLSGQRGWPFLCSVLYKYVVDDSLCLKEFA